MQNFIEKYNLIKHPEGGWYKETYYSDINYHDNPSIMTSIYFLLTKDEYSAFHQLKSDEIWYFHDGDPLDIYAFDEDYTLHHFILGRKYDHQIVIPKNWIFASKTRGEYSFVGCAVAPGFMFEDFKLFDFEKLWKYINDDNLKIVEELCYKKNDK